MRSSISSFSPPRPARPADQSRRRRAGVRAELKAIGVALVALLTLEAGARLRAMHPTWDYLRLKQLPAEARQLSMATAPRVVLLGNSLTRNAYDLPFFESQLPAPIAVVNAALYGSSLTEWYYLFQRNFISPETRPDVIMLHLSPGSAADSNPAALRIAWLAAETDWTQAPELLARDLPGFGNWAEYLQSRASVAFAQRWDLRAGFLRHVVPHYLNGLKWENARRRAAQDAAAAEAGPPQATYRLLDRLLTLARRHDIRVIIVAMPIREWYELDPALVQAIHAHGQTLLDCRAIPGLAPSDFEPDGWHLEPSGAKIFSAYMAHHLPALVSPHPTSE